MYNASDLQNLKATSCGFFVVAFGIAMKKKDKVTAFSNFLNFSSDDTKDNEVILHNLLKEV